MSEPSLKDIPLEKLVERLGLADAAALVGLSVAKLKREVDALNAATRRRVELHNQVVAGLQARELQAKFENALDVIVDVLVDAAADAEARPATSTDLLRRIARKFDLVPIDAKVPEILDAPKRLRGLLDQRNAAGLTRAAEGGAKRAAAGTRPAQVLALLANSPRKAADIAREVGSTTEVTFSLLQRLKSQGRLTNTNGLWSLSDSEVSR